MERMVRFRGQIVLRTLDKAGEESGIELDIKGADTASVLRALEVAKVFVNTAEIERE